MGHDGSSLMQKTGWRFALSDSCYSYKQRLNILIAICHTFELPPSLFMSSCCGVYAARLSHLPAAPILMGTCQAAAKDRLTILMYSQE